MGLLWYLNMVKLKLSLLLWVAFKHFKLLFSLPFGDRGPLNWIVTDFYGREISVPKKSEKLKNEDAICSIGPLGFVEVGDMN